MSGSIKEIIKKGMKDENVWRILFKGFVVRRMVGFKEKKVNPFCTF